MLDDKSEQVRLNIVQLISSVSEHPEGRKIAKQSLNKLNQMKLLPENSFLNMYIDETMKVITWMP